MNNTHSTEAIQTPGDHSIKRYIVKEVWKEYEVTLEVNHEILSEERAQLINNFWTDPMIRSGHCDGDVVKTVIQLFGQNAICSFLEDSGVSFDSGDKWLINKVSQDLRAEEGWGGESMDGEDNGLFGWCGIRVLAADVSMPSFDELDLAEIGVLNE